MKALEIGKIELSKKNKDFYNRSAYYITGETITLGDSEYDCTTYLVYSGKWTRSNTVRDCGDHYIYAGYSKYYSIDKQTLEITEDVEDR